ncbi:MAG TPA: efflux RND transporter periplasmic adaptor subunit, partial [Vicinamibacterales bacterium]|nr:efflux RND transporter periplasmic adaptor subunit [Vicinamibacterales bacterium]
PPMTVELARVGRADLTEHLTLVGNLIGAATVDVAPKVSGRLAAVTVRLGDRVAKGQVVARVEDSEIREQVAQAEASFEVARATIRQREADLKFAETSLERSRNLYQRQLLPKQTLDDNEARYQSAVAQLDLARAQYNQARARLEELRITLRDTAIVSPVDGFVGKRHLDPGAYVTSNSPVLSLVDIRFVRLVVNLVERDLRRVSKGTEARVVVDAFPSETFTGRVARIAPILDPATRTAEIEVEIPNSDFRLKPGMYARVQLVTARRPSTLAIPRNALIDADGQRGVIVPAGPKRAGPSPASTQGSGPPMLVARFVPVRTGIQDGDRVEILSGLKEGDTVVTTGAAGVRDGDPLLVGGGGQRPASARP